jgi:multiple sugar transport system ATP-binding protein
VTLGIRPEDVTLGADDGIAARVTSVEHLGANANATCVVRVADRRELTIVASIDAAHAPAREERLTLGADVERIHWFSAETGERLPDGR